MPGAPNASSGCGVAGSSASASAASLRFAERPFAPDGSGVSCRRGDAGFGFSSDGIDRKQCPQLNTFGAGGCEGCEDCEDCEGCEGWACWAC